MVNVARMLSSKNRDSTEKDSGLIARSAVVSLCTGLAATPFALQQIGWTAGKDPVVYVSAAVAFGADLILPFVLKVIENMIAAIQGKGKDQQ